MKLPALSSAEWRSWIYGLAWLGGGVASAALAIWLVTLVRWDWPDGTEEQRLTILGNALYGVIGCMALVTFGLTMRAAIRNFKGTAGGVSVEANSSAPLSDGDAVILEKV